MKWEEMRLQSVHLQSLDFDKNTLYAYEKFYSSQKFRWILVRIRDNIFSNL